ncbi:unnamed protein product [Kuraishia capsulata CBS 1993]|uniref:SH3 domain-containing protein n=1 Tax=Kuraishia capsulata CBS 1993 TaxID=1382522 RepID=W6MRW7_9ASCO|nr:uncharacterized protein KUCA_T00005442001 [Kuraishia capsulata CBS 1993]CDK29454.1 unnamed protein product [Kuraishia capsulata CBS 1993]
MGSAPYVMEQGINHGNLLTFDQELEFLRDSNVITDGLFSQIAESIPNRYSDGMAPADVRSQAGGAQSAAPQPQSQNHEELAEALYDYRPSQPEDLELHVGEKVKVLEKVSANWWKGSVGSRTGMFPANYVRLLGGNPYSQGPVQTAPQGQMYVPPLYPQQQQQQQQAPFPPTSTNYYQQQPVQQQAPQHQEQEQHQQQGNPNFKQQHPHISKFSSKLGNAAIFGAGATIGSDIINSIF